MDDWGPIDSRRIPTERGVNKGNRIPVYKAQDEVKKVRIQTTKIDPDNQNNVNNNLNKLGSN